MLRVLNILPSNGKLNALMTNANNAHESALRLQADAPLLGVPVAQHRERHTR